MSAAPGRDVRVDKAIHVVATSAVSWEDAARVAINEASLTIRDLSTGRVVDVDARLEPGGVVLYRVTLEIRFRIDRSRTLESGQRVEVRRYLVVGSVTLASGELHEVVLDRSKRGPSEFHVVVPCAAPPLGFVMGDPLSGYIGADMGPWIEPGPEVVAEAVGRLDEFTAGVRGAGANVTGEVGPPDPVRAVLQVLHRASFDEIIVSTLRPGLSRWLRVDLPSRLRRATGLPVTHVEVRSESQ